MESHKSWWEEMRSAYLYGVIAEHEKNILHKKLFLDLKVAAEKQAAIWSEQIKKEGLPQPTQFQPDWRTRLAAKLVSWFGVDALHSMLAAMKIRGMSVFNDFHREHKHTSLTTASNVRAAVFGVNDGLISNMSLILGIAGASSNEHFIILAGVAGLLAGACSMGAGEYISVRSQREVFEYQIAIERQELEEYPEEEAQELSLIYQARGMPQDDADKLAQLMISNPETGLNALAREELGLNPDDLVSPLGAMLYSFFSFAIGAFLPLIPFIIWQSSWNLYVSMGLTGIALFLIGSVLSVLTNRNPIWMGLRMLGIGVVAGLLTYFIGKLMGVALH